ncbi:hypothetical protein [Kordia sp.]|uniref:hypothetical protein n=1 Tax=Kordia sp. TaxID=1965332 RepID=UPI003D279475
MKRGTIFIEGTETLSYEKKSHKTEYVIYKLNTKEEIINVVSNIREGYKKIYFVESKKSLETRLTYWNRSFIKWLIEQNVLNLNGTINDEKVDSFIAKYDERITQRN